MSLDLRQELTSNDANGFVAKVFASPDASIQMANIHGAIEQARQSDNPDLQQFAARLNESIAGLATSERFEVDAELASRQNGWAGVLNEIMGADGEFQMSDLQNLDFGKLLGNIFKNLFNNEAGALQGNAASARSEANMGVVNALAYLDRAEAGGADVSGIRTLLGRDEAHLRGALTEIENISPGAPPPAPGA